MNRAPLEPAHRRYIRETYDAVVSERRDRLRLELERAARQGDDEHVQAILAELGPLAVEELDRLDDHGLCAGNWEIER